MSDAPVKPPELWSVARIEASAPDGKSLGAARELLRDGTFSQVEPTADGRAWGAVCRGTTDLYHVTVRPRAHGFDCACECPSRKYPCKHALALLLHLAGRPELRVGAESAKRASADFEGLLRTVFADPDDDTARLVFADYLDENDPNPDRAGGTRTTIGTWTGSWADRAALIRVQCEQSRLPGRDPRAAELAKQEKVLLDRIDTDMGRFPEELGVEFRRGFVRLRVGPRGLANAASLPARVANLFTHGWVESVWFRDGFLTVGAEAYSLLQRVGELDFGSVRQNDVTLVRLATDMRVGAEGQRLARVRVHPDDEALYHAYYHGTSAPPQAPHPNWGGTYWSSSDIAPDHLERLLRTGRVEGITELTFYNPSFGDRGAEVLAAGEGLELQSLTLATGVGPVGAAALAGARWFPQLTTLSVTDCPFEDDGVAALGRPTGACALTNLRLVRVGLGDAGAAALSGSARFLSLESLDLQDNELTEAGCAALLCSEHFPRLKFVALDASIPAAHRVRLALDARERPDQPILEVQFGGLQVVRASTVSATGATHRVTIRRADPDALTGATSLNQISALTFEDSTFTPEASVALAAALAPGVLRHLDLTGCSLGEKPAEVIERLCTGHRLATLDLTRTGFKYADVYKLARCPALASVKVLDLSANPMGTGGLEALLTSPYLGGVERFVLKELNLTQRERGRFQKEFGKRAEF